MGRRWRTARPPGTQVAVIHRVKNRDAQSIRVITDNGIVGDECQLRAEGGGMALQQEQVKLAVEFARPLAWRPNEQNPVGLRPADFIPR